MKNTTCPHCKTPKPIDSEFSLENTTMTFTRNIPTGVEVWTCNKCNCQWVEEKEEIVLIISKGETLKPKTVYVASNFTYRDKVKKIVEILKQYNIHQTYDWWNHEFKHPSLSDDAYYNKEEVKQARRTDFKGIDDADNFIIVSSIHKALHLNGANIELGYAIAKQKHIYILGKVKRTPMYEGLPRYNNIKDIISKINKGE